MKPSPKDSFLKNNEKYLFIILLLATISIVGYSLDKGYSQLEKPQMKDKSSNSNEDDQTNAFSKDKSKNFVKITSHKNAEVVETGELTINGTSSDSNSRDCIVEVDWNNDKPSQIVTPTGPGGSSDFSTWTFTYTKKYHEIEEGPNELTSKLTCINPGPLTKWFSVTLTGTPPPFPRPLPVP